jgi:hypothetical protein
MSKQHQVTKTKYPTSYRFEWVPSDIRVDNSRAFISRAFVSACKKLIAERPRPNRHSLPEDGR